MSTLYPDLSLTNFPSSVDQFTTWLNIVATDGPLIQQYQTAMEAGDITLANQILAQIPQGTQKIITATDLNTLTQAMLAVERFYLTDIKPYIEQKQEDWLSVIQQFSYKGVWQSNTSYVTNNFVSYTVSGLTLLYLAVSDPPVGNVPTNSQYWRVLTLQGQQGVSGQGLSYRQEWQSSSTYYTNDAVTYNGAIWMAVTNSQGIEPNASNPTYWQLIMPLVTTTYPIQNTQPTSQSVGELWFNTNTTPTQYYYLAGLTTPASASDITYGKEAYDANGNLIVGTIPVPTSLFIDSSQVPSQYLINSPIDVTNLKITVTFSDGSSKIVTNYDYSPKTVTSSSTKVIVTYSVGSNSVSGNFYVSGYTPNSILENNTWQVIGLVSDANLGSNYWSVGDSKSVEFSNATVGNKQFTTSTQMSAIILGFNHNSYYEGDNLIHFCLCKIPSSSNRVALIDNNYNTTGSSAAFRINLSDTVSGGWENSYMRNTIMNGMRSCMDNRNYFKTVKKYTNNVGANNNLSSITQTEETVFLLSIFEVYGNTGNANDYESYYQNQYDFFKLGNYTNFTQDTNPTQGAESWSRSPAKNGLYCIISPTNQQSTNLNNANYSYGIAPCFCV